MLQKFNLLKHYVMNKDKKMNAILEAKSISKIYDEGKIKTEVLLGLDLTIQAGERVAIVGSSF